MEDRTKKILTAAGVAAATAGIAVAATRRARHDGEPLVYHVRSAAEGWAVERDGSDRATSLHATKKEAVSAARDLARSRAPSRLIIHGVDGSELRSHEYEVAE